VYGANPEQQDFFGNDLKSYHTSTIARFIDADKDAYGSTLEQDKLNG
jgi:hypothetical protein